MPPRVLPQIFALKRIYQCYQKESVWTFERGRAVISELGREVLMRAQGGPGVWSFYTRYTSLGDDCELWLRLELPTGKGAARLSLEAAVYGCVPGIVLWRTDWLLSDDSGSVEMHLSAAALRMRDLYEGAVVAGKETANRLAGAAMRLDFDYRFVLGADAWGACLWELLPLTRQYAGVASAVLISKIGGSGSLCCFLCPVLGFLREEVAHVIERHIEASTVLDSRRALPGYVFAGR